MSALIWAIIGDYTKSNENLVLILEGQSLSIPLTEIYRCIMFVSSEETQENGDENP